MKPRSAEHCRHISEVKRGRPRSDMIGNQFGAGKIPWNKGKKFGPLSEEQRKKLSDIHIKLGAPKWLSDQKGETHPLWKGGKPICRDCGARLKSYVGIRCKKCSFTGSLSPSWKGGLTSLALRVRHCAEYQKWRTAIFQRDNFTCQLCGNGGYIEADHFPKPFAKILSALEVKTIECALACSELWDTANGRTLCGTCHNKTKRPLKSTSG